MSFRNFTWEGVGLGCYRSDVRDNSKKRDVSAFFALSKTDPSLRINAPPQRSGYHSHRSSLILLSAAAALPVWKAETALQTALTQKMIILP